MAAFYGHAHGGGAHSDGAVPQDFTGFVHHLHLLLGIAVREEGVYVRQNVQVYPVRKFGAGAAGAFRFQLLDAPLAGTRDALVGAHHNTLDAIGLMQRRKRQHHLDGGAVGVGDDVVVLREDIGIDFRDHQRDGRVHAPIGGVVHHVAANFCELRCQLCRCRSAGAENGQHGLAGNGFGGTHYRPFLALEGHFFAPGTFRSNWQQLRYREVPLLKNLQHFRAHQARGTYYGYYHFMIN